MLSQTGTPCVQATKQPHATEPRMLVLSDAADPRGRRHSILDRLTPAEREYVVGQCTPRRARKHSTIFRQGEVQKGIYLILSGSVRVFYAAPSGREITRAYWFAGHFIGGPDVFAEMPNMWSAVALRDTSLLLLPSATLRTLCARIPNLAIGLIEAMAFKGRCYAAMAQMLGTRAASERMMQVLRLLAEMYGATHESGSTIDVPITQEEIAHLVGATRQWVTVNLRRLQDRGLVDANRGRLLIRDATTLATVARI